jgi:hypothetical protein
MAIVLRCFRKGSRFRRLLHSQSVELDGEEFVSMQWVSINGLRGADVLAERTV